MRAAHHRIHGDVLVAATNFAPMTAPRTVSKSSMKCGSPIPAQPAAEAGRVPETGDTVRTGKNGRPAQAREENHDDRAHLVVGVPAEKKDGYTTIVQQAG